MLIGRPILESEQHTVIVDSDCSHESLILSWLRNREENTRTLRFSDIGQGWSTHDIP